MMLGLCWEEGRCGTTGPVFRALRVSGGMSRVQTRAADKKFSVGARRRVTIGSRRRRRGSSNFQPPSLPAFGDAEGDQGSNETSIGRNSETRKTLRPEFLSFPSIET